MDEEKSLWPGRIGLVIATIAAVIWSIVGALPDVIKQYAPDVRAGDYAPLAGALTGHTMVIAVVVFAILYVLLLRGSDASRGVRYFLTIFFITIAVDAGLIAAAKNIAAQHDVQYRQALADMGRMMQLSKSKNDEVSGFQIHATGDAGVIAAITKNEISTMVRLRNEYQTKVHALGLRSALAPASLATDGGPKEARMRIVAARALVKTYRDAELKALADAQSAIANARLPASEKEQVLAGFDRSVKNERPMLEEMWDDEDGMLAESDAMTHDLAQANWKARGAGFVFSSRRDLETYQAHQQKIHQLAQDERDTVARLQANATVKIPNGTANLN